MSYQPSCESRFDFKVKCLSCVLTVDQVEISYWLIVVLCSFRAVSDAVDLKRHIGDDAAVS